MARLTKSNYDYQKSRKNDSLTEMEVSKRVYDFIDSYGDQKICYKDFYKFILSQGSRFFSLFYKRYRFYYDYWSQHNIEVERVRQEQNECEQDSPTTTNT